MFRGHAEARIDAKGRLKMPRLFLHPLQEKFGPDIFTTSLNGDCAWIYPLEIWEKWEQELGRLPSSNTRRRDYLRRVSYFGQQGRLDAQGRMTLPSRLRERAGIDGAVVLLGNMQRLEIWNLERMEAEIEPHPFSDDDLDRLTLDLRDLDADG